MKKLLLIAFSFIGVSCGKSDDPNPNKSLTGLEFKTYTHTSSEGAKYYNRLHFISDTEAQYFWAYEITAGDVDYEIGSGEISTLKYKIKDPKALSPLINITGDGEFLKNTDLNSKNGKVNCVLVYTPATRVAKGSLTLKESSIYFIQD